MALNAVSENNLNQYPPASNHVAQKAKSDSHVDLANRVLHLEMSKTDFEELIAKQSRTIQQLSQALEKTQEEKAALEKQIHHLTDQMPTLFELILKEAGAPYERFRQMSALNLSSKSQEVTRLVELYSKLVDQKLTPLHYATINGDISLVQDLVRKGASVDSNVGEWTPLHIAARYDREKVAEFFIENKANVNARGNGQKTPLHYAAAYGGLAMVSLLVSNEAEINAQDYDQWTPLHFAASHGNEDVLDFLKSKGADVNAKNNTQKTAAELLQEYKNNVRAVADPAEIKKFAPKQIKHVAPWQVKYMSSSALYQLKNPESIQAVSFDRVQYLHASQMEHLHPDQVLAVSDPELISKISLDALRNLCLEDHRLDKTDEQIYTFMSYLSEEQVKALLSKSNVKENIAIRFKAFTDRLSDEQLEALLAKRGVAVDKAMR